MKRLEKEVNEKTEMENMIIGKYYEGGKGKRRRKRLKGKRKGIGKREIKRKTGERQGHDERKEKGNNEREYRIEEKKEITK